MAILLKYGIDKILSPLASLTLHEETSECKSCHERLPINQGGSRASQALYNKHVYIMKKKNFSFKKNILSDSQDDSL